MRRKKLFSAYKENILKHALRFANIAENEKPEMKISTITVDL